jgi:multicomponent Na+:H+ antiporter subunit A
VILWLTLGLHVVGIIVILLWGRFRSESGRAVFVIPAVPALVGTGVALSGLVRDDVIATDVVWVDTLELIIAFRLDALAAVLGVIVAGIGALVFVYAGGYFTSTSPATARFAATLSAFSASMLGLVWADSIWTLFIFWELTSITSYLLVGHKHTDPATQLAARRALLITASGGLALLAGLVLLADGELATGLRDLAPLGGTSGAVAAVLVLVGAATKSAQVPFHVWLPGAMSAPTPVSAYLHSATMVKAGVIAVALFGPALGETGPWTPVGVAFGLVSMVWGAVGALRHVDAKLILAWGTISQLGLMIALLSYGSPKATFAALSILVAHAIFKAALFMVVGEIDVRTGTRDVRELAGLWRSMPIAFGVAVVSGLSMAGVPPLLGFPTKEAAIEAALGASGVERVVLLVGIVGGSVLTVAYTTRFLIATFGPGTQGAELTLVAPRRAAITVATSILGVGSVVGFVALGTVTAIVRDAAILLDPDVVVYSLIRWPGLKTAFVISIGIVVVGAAVGAFLARRSIRVARPVGADAVDAGVDGVLALARRTAAVVQHGSLPVYMVTAIVATLLAAVPFVAVIDVDALELWDTPLQAAVGVIIVVGAVGTIRIPGRLGAALGLGSVGFGMAGLFAIHGAPDLALTQLLVETVVVVGFVVGLGHLSREFPHVGHVWRTVRIVVSVGFGLAVSLGLAAAAANPTGVPPLEELTERAVEIGGGNNIVNVILTDVRALDTFGEVVVLVAVSMGILMLARVHDRERGVRGVTGEDER